MWYFVVVSCFVGTLNCITGKMPVPNAHTEKECYSQSVDWIALLADVRVRRHKLDTSFKCERAPETEPGTTVVPNFELAPPSPEGPPAPAPTPKK